MNLFSDYLTCRISAKLLVICGLTIALSSCGIKRGAPEFKPPKYVEAKTWPKLSPTAELEKASDVDVQAELDEVEAVQELIGDTP